jgi:PKD repeat protein
MRKKLFLLICMIALAAVAIAAPGAFAKPEYYVNCQVCHGGGDPDPKKNAPSNGATCMGCHQHGGRNITATPDRTQYAPGDTITVTLDTTANNRGGWIRAKLFDKASPSNNDVPIDIQSNPCRDCQEGVGGVNGITTEYPATLIASAPAAPGTYTWSAAWFGNPSGSSYGTHRDVSAQFTFNVVAPDANNPPIADAAGPYNGTVNEPVAFDGSGSSDSDGTIVAWDWDFGDGSTGTGQMPTHTYAGDGRFTVTLTVTDDAGDTGSDTSRATIGVGNQTPVAAAGGPYNGMVNEPVAFDGSSSSDPDGSIVAWDWDFGDGNTGTGEMPTHSYAEGGTYNVTLTVTDDMGAQDSAGATAAIGLGNQAPIADAGGPYTGTVNESVTFDGSGSSDPDGSIVAWDWDFGDGNTGTGETPTHTYAGDGSFTLTLTVTDDAGDIEIDTTTVTIGPGNRPPIADAGSPYNGTVNEPLAFDGSGSSDPDGIIVAYDWDFSDGSTGTGPTPTHTYHTDGIFTVTLTVTDNMGATDSTTRTATIGLGNQPPIADANNPYIGEVNEPIQFDGSNSSDPDGFIVAHDWDFGDGGTGTGETPTHAYTTAGMYNVTLTVTDNMGASDSTTRTATIGQGNQPPIADANNPYNGTVNEPIQFDGSNSSDPDGTIVAYDWDFGDGGTGTGPAPTHAYTTAGTYTVTLTVTDDLGASDSTTRTATIVQDTQPPADNPDADDDEVEEDKDDEYERDDEESEKGDDRGKGYGRKKPFKNGRQNDRDDD